MNAVVICTVGFGRCRNWTPSHLPVIREGASFLVANCVALYGDHSGGVFSRGPKMKRDEMTYLGHSAFSQSPRIELLSYAIEIWELANWARRRREFLLHLNEQDGDIAPEHGTCLVLAAKGAMSLQVCDEKEGRSKRSLFSFETNYRSNPKFIMFHDVYDASITSIHQNTPESKCEFQIWLISMMFISNTMFLSNKVQKRKYENLFQPIRSHQEG